MMLHIQRGAESPQHRDIRIIGFKEVPQCAAVRGRATIPKSPWKPSAAAGRRSSCLWRTPREAAVVESVDVYGACSLSQVVRFLRGYIAFEPVRSLNRWPGTGSAEQDLDFGEVKGQQHVKRRRSRRRPAGTTFSPLDLFLPLVETH
jgi:predicted ATPase with chaperone activity